VVINIGANPGVKSPPPKNGEGGLLTKPPQEKGKIAPLKSGIVLAKVLESSFVSEFLTSRNGESNIFLALVT